MITMRRYFLLIPLIGMVGVGVSSRLLAEETYYQDIPGEDDQSVDVESVIQGDQLRGETLFIAVKGQFRSKNDAEESRRIISEMPNGVEEGIDFSTHYDGISRGYWLVFSAFDNKEKAKAWLDATPQIPKRKAFIKKVVKHNGTAIPYNRSLPMLSQDPSQHP